jgi:ribosomal protein L14
MKNLFGAIAFMCLMLVVACQKTDDLPFADDTETAVEELLTVSIGTLTTRGDSTMHGGGGSHDHHGGFGNRGGGRHTHPAGMRGDSIGFVALPQAAQTYINTNKGGTTNVKMIVKVTLPDGTVRYGVRFNDKTHLHFDANGAVVATENRDSAFTEITFADLPAAAKTFLTANADVTKISHVIKVTKKDGSVFFGVRLSDGKHFHFDANGTVVEGKNRKRR